MTPCIPFPGCRTDAGYGLKHHEGKLRLAHRVAFVVSKGIAHEDIDGLVVRHECDNPACWNAEHLLIGTQSENIKDCVARGRHTSPRGETHHAAVLYPDAVRDIRSNNLSLRANAKRYGVSIMTVSDARNRKTWKDI